VKAVESPLLIGARSATARTSLGDRFRILCWNVHKESSPAFLADLHRLVDPGRVDIVLLQEATISADSMPIALKNHSWRHSANLQDAIHGRAFGVATASLVLPIQEQALLSTGREPFLGTKKAALLTRYPSALDTLTVVNLHALNFSLDLDGFRQQLLAIHRVLGPEPGSAIVAGDFNTWSRKKRNLADSILSLSGMIAVDFGGEGKKRTTAFGHPLDHVYYTPRWLQVDSNWLHVHDSIRSSDHIPLEVGFRLLAIPDPKDRNLGQDDSGSIPTDRIR